MTRSTNEDEYFAREDAEKLRKIAADQRAALDAAEKARLAQLHKDRCPSCGMAMGAVTFRGMHIRRCFTCNDISLTGADFEKLAHDSKGGLMQDVLRIFEHKHTL